MKPILFRAETLKDRTLIESGCVHQKDNRVMLAVTDRDLWVYVDPETIERLVHEENGVQYFTGDKLAVYCDIYPSFEEALAEGDACVSEIGDNGLVILEHKEILLPVDELTLCCYKFHLLTREEYETFNAN